ncbi:MAG: sulfotransferase domain-containing protein [Candidatus Hodarchaeales archaeon]|jgi:hypothetical protein
MRLFVTSYQKSGTHQIMPALGINKDIVDRSLIAATGIPEKYGTTRVRNENGVQKTCVMLKYFKKKAFGHVPYNPEYAECIQTQPTKVLFNVRDPRDIIVAVFYNMNKVYFKGKRPGAKGYGHLNLVDKNGKLLIQKNDPISELIKIEAGRWPHWLGWLQHDFVMKVKYEDLRLRGVETLRKISEFIYPHPLNFESASARLTPRHHNPTFRAGRVGDWKKDFTDKHKKLAEKLLGDIIIQLGYEV